jgi:ABC-type transporter Mla maintaining outer membrane lipid asymmetry permease subunit MlaE
VPIGVELGLDGEVGGEVGEDVGEDFFFDRTLVAVEPSDVVGSVVSAALETVLDGWVAVVEP